MFQVQSELVQAAGTSMEEEIKMPEKEQGDDDAGKEGESSADSSSIKPGRGKPLGLKKLKVCVTDFRLMGLVSGISNGGSTQPKRGRGRPKLPITTNTEKEEEEKEEKEERSGDDQAPDSVPAHRGRGRPKGTKTSTGDDTPRKRGRPKKSPSSNTPASENVPNGDSESPKRKRGRPKGSVKRVSESAKEDEGSLVKRKRGRPKGSSNKKSRRQREESSEEEEEEEETETEEDTDGSVRSSSPLERVGRQIRSTGSNGISDTPKRQRGRPRKSRATDDSPEFPRGIGRPKGSLNKKRPASQEQETASRSMRVHIRPQRLTSSPPAKRGRPRKYPLPTAEERNKPKEWKPLGRPRKYPRADPPEGAAAAAPAGPRRGRGRPPKTQSKRAAHLRKRLPAPSSPSNPDDDPPRKSTFLNAAKNEAVVPRKRGRPKGSGNKSKAREETELDRASPTGGFPPVEEHEAELAEEEEHEVEPAEEEEHEAEPAEEEKHKAEPAEEEEHEAEPAEEEEHEAEPAEEEEHEAEPAEEEEHEAEPAEEEEHEAEPAEEEEHKAEPAEEEEQTTSPEHVGDTEEKLVEDLPRKSRHALSAAKKEAVVPRKRGRPKGSGNKNKAREETELDRASPTGGFPPVEEHEAELAEEEEHEAEPAEEEEQTTEEKLVDDTPRKSRHALSAAKKDAVVPRKRGRPKGNKNKAREETELDRASPNGDSELPKRKRGRPKRSVQHVSESAKEDEGGPVEEHEAEPAEEEQQEPDADFEVSEQA